MTKQELKEQLSDNWHDLHSTIDPKTATANWFLARIAERDQELIKEIKAMEKAQLDPTDPDNYGACYAISGFNDSLNKAISLIESHKL